MTLLRTLSRATAPVVDLVYPPRCPLCGDAIAQQTGLCQTCWSELVIPSDPACAACQRPFGDSSITGEAALCAPCMAAAPRHDGIMAGTLYNEASRQLVLKYKHGRRIALAPMLARLITARMAGLEGEWLLIPVPLHPLRLWARGFNQSALLAKELSRATGHSVAVDALRRIKRTPPLGGMGRKARERTLAGSIRVAPRQRESISGSNVVLVDDVLTSGATSDACVGVLKRAGAQQVKIACFARVLHEVTGYESARDPKIPGAP
ncbi:ComF family protein [Qipengyuania sp. JC766]|uniref:ComF family protein n=1 Tax=Qipengyuania sp. JC766 TaxID=3232139 RepID=UPI00345B1B96